MATKSWIQNVGVVQLFPLIYPLSQCVYTLTLLLHAFKSSGNIEQYLKVIALRLKTCFKLICIWKRLSVFNLYLTLIDYVLRLNRFWMDLHNLSWRLCQIVNKTQIKLINYFWVFCKWATCDYLGYSPGSRQDLSIYMEISVPAFNQSFNKWCWKHINNIIPISLRIFKT